MHEIEEDLARLEGYLDALRGEVARLRQKVQNWERDSYDPGEDPASQESAPPNSAPVDSSRNLAELYDQGYHVCNVHFGEPRWGQDCLFCTGLLQRGEAGV